MERRNFLKLLASVPLVVAAFIDYKGETQQPEPPKYKLQKRIDQNPPERLVISTKLEADEVTTKDFYENGNYQPKWNVSGSWTKAQSREVLISHLMGANHGFKKSHLDTLSTDELQKLHDDDHNRTKITPRRRLFRFR